MRVKSLLGPAGLALMVAISIPGISGASRGNVTEEPVEVVEDVPAVEEEAPEPVVEEAPVVEETPEEVVEELPAEPVAEEEPAEEAPAPKPKVKPVPVEEPAPVIEESVVEPEPVEAFARPEKETDEGKGACHMDDYKSAEVNSLNNDGESARAEKVDRNDNGTVCRKEIPGQGRGNTGNGTNIKDDHAR